MTKSKGKRRRSKRDIRFGNKGSVLYHSHHILMDLNNTYKLIYQEKRGDNGRLGMIRKTSIPVTIPFPDIAIVPVDTRSTYTLKFH